MWKWSKPFSGEQLWEQIERKARATTSKASRTPHPPILVKDKTGESLWLVCSLFDAMRIKEGTLLTIIQESTLDTDLLNNKHYDLHVAHIFCEETGSVGVLFQLT